MDALEPLARLGMRMGDVVSVVGVNGTPPAPFQEEPSRNPIALITQHTTFLSDLPEHELLRMHARIRGAAAS